MEVDGDHGGLTDTYAQEGTTAPSPEIIAGLGASGGEQAAWVSLVHSTKGQSRLPFSPPLGLAPPHPAESRIQ
eukprot:6015604-Heterocapsa_arctica.AAC.1